MTSTAANKSSLAKLGTNRSTARDAIALGRTDSLYVEVSSLQYHVRWYDFYGPRVPFLFFEIPDSPIPPIPLECGGTGISICPVPCGLS